MSTTYEVTEIRSTAFSYKTIAGESWGNVARKTRGDDTLAVVIAKANPGISEPLPGGLMITIPALPPSEFGFQGAELEILVNGQDVQTADDFSISYAIDGIRKAQFSVPNTPETRKIFYPLGCNPVLIGATAELLIKGRALSPVGISTDALQIEVVSDAEPIETCNAPISAYPLEFVEMDLEQIAEALLSPLGFTAEFSESSGDILSVDSVTGAIGKEPSKKAKAGARFSKTTIEQEIKVLDFLADLAKQRNFTITAKADGTILFWREAAAGSPVAKLDAEKYPVVSSQATFDDSVFYSSVTGIIEADPRKKKSARSFTVANPWAEGLQKPYTFTVQDVDDGELETVVQTESARMFAGVFSVDLEVSTWRDDAGKIWQPNTTILLRDPVNYLDDFIELTISEVTLTKSATAKGARLKLTLPGGYGGQIPESIPWR